MNSLFMRCYFTASAISVFYFLNLVSPPAFATEHVRWHLMDYPPLYFIDGPDKGKGAADIVQKMIIERLGNGYTHESLVVNDARSRKESKSGINACFVGGVYNDPDYVSSIPVAAILPHLIVIKDGQQKQFGDNTTISLKRLLKNNSLTLGVQKDRSRGEILDRIIQEHRHQKNVQIRGLYTLPTLLKMIHRERIDYTIDYSYWVQNAIKQNKLKSDIAFLQIEENIGTIMRGGVVCTKNDWGKRIIKKINAILAELRPTKEYRKIFIDLGYIPVGFEKQFWEIYETQVLQVQPEKIL